MFSLFIKWPFLFGRSAGHRPERTLLYDIGTPSEACAPKLVSNGICGERTNWLRTDRNPTGEALHLSSVRGGAGRGGAGRGGAGRGGAGRGGARGHSDSPDHAMLSTGDASRFVACATRTVGGTLQQFPTDELKALASPTDGRMEPVAESLAHGVSLRQLGRDCRVGSSGVGETISEET